MKKINKNWTTVSNEGVLECVCTHGIGHSPFAHSCDGCCTKERKLYDDVLKEVKKYRKKNNIYQCPFCKREVPNKENKYCEKCL